MAASPISDSIRMDRCLREISIKIFENPDLIVQAVCHRNIPSFSVSRHAHRNLLQLDYAVGYAGEFSIGTKRYPLKNITAMAFYPNQRHDFTLKPMRAEAEVYSIKLRVSSNSRLVTNRIVPQFVYGISSNPELLRALRTLVRLSVSPRSSSLKRSLAAVEVLNMWPQRPDHAITMASENIQSISADGIARALHGIESQLSKPPDLKSLAAMANLSPRHFVRKFKSLLGCTPHDYVSSLRLMRARELLAHGKYNITEIADELGFSSIHAFSRWFTSGQKISPKRYQKNHTLL